MRWSAGFPAGTLSGAPKVRAMEIIEELEPDRRGIYAGCIGYFAANGTMDTCIGLRTALVKDGDDVCAGGRRHRRRLRGGVGDEECRQKARALVRAAEEAVRFAAGKSRARTTRGESREPDAHSLTDGPRDSRRLEFRKRLRRVR